MKSTILITALLAALSRTNAIGLPIFTGKLAAGDKKQANKSSNRLKDGDTVQVGYTVEIDSVTEEPDAACEAIFDAAFESSFDTAFAAQGDQIEDVTVEGSHPEAAVATALGSTGAYSYVYFGYGGFCRRCAPGLNVPAHVYLRDAHSDFETLFAQALSSSSCTAFASVTSVTVTFTGDDTPQVKKQADRLKEETHQVGYTVEIDSVTEEPGAGCEAIFDDAFEEAFDTAFAAEGDQMRDVTVEGGHPEAAAAKSLTSTGAYSYVYFGYGGFCRRCSPNRTTKNLRDAHSTFESLFAQALSSSSCTAFASVTSVTVTFTGDDVPELKKKADRLKEETHQVEYTVEIDSVTEEPGAGCEEDFDRAFQDAFDAAFPGDQMQDVTVVDSHPEVVAKSLRATGAYSYVYFGYGGFCRRCAPGLDFRVQVNELRDAHSDFEGYFAENLRNSNCAAFASVTSVAVTFTGDDVPELKKKADRLKEETHQVGYTVELNSVTTEPDASCEAIFDAAFESSFDTAFAAEGSQIEDVTVEGGHPETTKSLGSTGAYSYVYFGYGGFCRRCAPGFKVKMVRDAHSDFEALFAQALSSSSCAAFATVESVTVTFTGDDVPSMVADA